MNLDRLRLMNQKSKQPKPIPNMDQISKQSILLSAKAEEDYFNNGLRNHSRPPIKPQTRNSIGDTESFVKAGRKPIRKKRPAPLPRAYTERAIDVPKDFDLIYNQNRHSCFELNTAMSSSNKSINLLEKPPRTWTKIDDETEIVELNEEEEDLGNNYNHLNQDQTVFRESAEIMGNGICYSKDQSVSCGSINNIGFGVRKKGNVVSQSVPDIPTKVDRGTSPINFNLPPPKSKFLDQGVLKEIDRQSIIDEICSNDYHCSTIELNSIMNRNSEFYITKSSQSKSFIYSDCNDSANYEQLNKLDKFDKKITNPIRFKKVPNVSPKAEKSRSSSSFQEVCQRFGSSIQNLVFSSEPKKLGRKSVSELNLFKSGKKVNNLGDQRQSYCPSALNSMTKGKTTTSPSPSKISTMKRAWRKVTNFKRRSIDPHDETIQDLDGAFFEKFGSLLRQKSVMDEEQLTTPLAPLPEDILEVGEEAVVQMRTMENVEGEEDSGNETLHDTDSEPEDEQNKQLDFVEGVMGWNLEELYEEIVFEILHNVGAEMEHSPSELFTYVQDAFKISDVRHEELLEEAKTKEAPEIRLNVEIIEAKDLVPKDPNGLSDPFVTMFIATVPTHRYNTSVKPETCNPRWEEHFSLPISENKNEDQLVIEVWDFDPAETVKEKMNKLFDVKGVRGLRKLMKEIAVTASSGKHDNELIGKASISLKSIPASGLVMWYNLDKKNRVKSRGLIKIRLNFSSEKNNKVAVQEHRHLLKILLLHELETSKVAPYWWSGKFTTLGETILTQHYAQSGITAAEDALIKWSVYTDIHTDHPLAFSLFDSLLDKIIRPIQSDTVNDDELKIFWDSTKKLLPSCFAVIRKLRKKTAGDKNSVKTLMEILNILSKVAMLEPPEGTDLFPKSSYGWISRDENEPSWDIRGTLRDAVHAGAEDWFNTINDETECLNGSDESKLQHIIKLIQLVRSDLQRGIEYYDKIFQETVNFHYARALYSFYESRLADYIEPIVLEISKNIKRIEIPMDESEKLESHQEINMGTTLFELYLVLKRFVVLGTALNPGETDFKINKYHNWFTTGVTHWLDISVYKALTRIEKAIELDQLAPVDDTVKYSSSAVDTLAIFYQIKIFWQQLAWPDVEGAYMFIGKIVDDICRCCVFYADKMSERVEGLGEVRNIYENKFEVTKEWCLAINNIDYIRQSLEPFVQELGVEDILVNLADYRSPMEAQRCRDTLKNVIENAIDTERNKILELVDTVAKKMSPMIRKFLLEGAEFIHQDSNSLDRLMMYLEDSLKTLHMELNEVNFARILDCIWNELASILYQIVEMNLEKRRPPSFFQNLKEALRIMIKSFKAGNTCESSDKETLESIQKTLELHSLETAELIHQYYLERAQEQQSIDNSPFGQLTVRCNFKNDAILEIEVLSARNLKPMDSNGSCDPFVRIHFLPEVQFNTIAKPKTSSQSKTLFPIFDEKFVITLTPEQFALKDALILFSVKDKDLFGMSNQYIAESLLSFREIADGNEKDQMHLTLTRPDNLSTESDCIRALELRQFDKQAKDFLKRLKQKVNNQA